MEPAQHNGRAVVLVAVAITTGVLLLGVGFDPDGSTGLQGAEPAAPEPEVEPAPAITPTPAPTETPTPVLAPASTVRVLVANATDVAGAAAVASDSLIATYGYNALPPVNATADPNVLTSAVYHLPDHDGDARRIAELLGIDPGAVGPMPPDPPVADLADAAILVVIGTDLVVEPPDE